MSAIKLPSWVQQLNATKKSTSLTPEQQERLDKARDYAKSIGQELLARKPKLDAEIAELAATQHSAHWMERLPIFCRIYIGGVNYDVLEVHLRAVFGQFGYLTSVTLSYEAMESRHKGFSFIEFDTPEGATNAIQAMDGALLGGRNIKVGRPQQYPEEGNSVLPKAPKSRIYISNIRDVVAENDIKEMFEAYGTIKAVALPPESNQKKHKGYGFVEYENSQSATSAIQAMNGFELGGQALRVTKAVLGGAMPRGMTVGRTATSTGKALPANLVSITNAINSSVASN